MKQALFWLAYVFITVAFIDTVISHIKAWVTFFRDVEEEKTHEN